MSEMARTAREASRAKAARMTRADPHQKVDASSWSPGEPMNADAMTGMRPVSKRQFRRGGKVHGEKAAQRADRKPRASGGQVDDYINRNVRSANAELGKPHTGGFNAGGATNFRKQMHADVAEDKRLIKHMVKPAAIRSKKRNGGGQWIAGAIKHPGALHEELHVPKGEKIPAKKLAKAAHSDNPKMKKRAELAETLERMHKARGGNIDSTGMRPTGDRIPRKSGGRTKGKTNIVIAIHSGQQPQQQPMMPPQAMAKPPMGVPVPPPAPPQAPPMGLGAGGPQMPMPMPRKSGGRAEYPTIASAKRVRSPKDMDAGGLSGLGRIEKTALAERTYARAK